MADIKMFQCDECEYKTSLKGNLGRHVKAVHDRIKDIECGHCDRMFSDKGTLNQHIKEVHSKIQDFNCDQCPKMFTRKGHLKLHIKQVHSKIQDFNCNRCSYICSTNNDLTRHIKLVHDKIRDKKCTKCEYTCSLNSHLKTHSITCTGGRVGSFGEVKIRDILDGFGIKYIYNQTNEQLTRYCNKNLRFDFEIDLHGEKLFLEFDGRQHFEPVTFGGISIEKAQMNFRRQQYHDHIKNDFCELFDYRLLRISYLDSSRIEQLIVDFLHKYTLFGFEL